MIKSYSPDKWTIIDYSPQYPDDERYAVVAGWGVVVSPQELLGSVLALSLLYKMEENAGMFVHSLGVCMFYGRQHMGYRNNSTTDFTSKS